ncbi:molecular chaperone TorD family protein [Adlercreutzia sp. R25]|uniref:Molecular chaperone TorD family protein n=1 Tax=Adlercreutzia shanghongiae TaxID=3111773 RepID=A0ABU6IYP4_9ACTN|nr:MULTISPECIES: molecular chaperone TorD family protein [unclassified Adlercreutzia]MEC4271816.1 molecular chaperone TorD family protein [Adlercreutzia sp. R25]MEC4294823.1 molecular chaperone TorD family protein [Adlercreutzia sp. R22]
MGEMRDEALALDALMLSRAYMYRLLGLLFGGEPNREFIETLVDQNTRDVLDEYREESPAIDELAGYLANLGVSFSDESIDRARSEFTRVFVGPSTLPALPWGSPYESGDPVMFQKGTLKVREIYRLQGYRPARLQHVPDDHIALECNFMARLAFGLAGSFEDADFATVREGLVSQKSFLGQCMTGWIARYAVELKDSGKAPFYGRLVEAAAEFVRLDDVFLGEALQWLKDVAEIWQPSDLKQALEAASQSLASIREALQRLFALKLEHSEEFELVRAS